ncbi:MAG: helix-turn-helix domain-containing protein [Ancylobacter novellus]|uniref:Helix-turn-helix domain-containing protein n=1 Tax=Ancylobacter novellus TaxID=921 RepID=A0A2W5SX41_ANCNO|nr:MAG: helix-turn-helix domain-containing protein [Ancylobacter novellus]
MSVEAITWANKQRAGSSGAKLVLLALANYADEQGRCWPSYRTLADVTEMSADSISRHVATLESRSLCAREARFDDNGRRMSNVIRLLLNGGGTPANCGVPTPANSGGTPPQKQGVRTPQKQGDLNPQYDPSNEPTPQTPEGAGVGSFNSDEEGEGGGAAADTQFDVLWSEYGADPTASRAKALRAWSRLSAVDQAQALALLPRFLDYRRANKIKLCHPATYLADRCWEGLASLPAPAARAEAVPARPAENDPARQAVAWAMSTTADRTGWVFVAEGSDAWRAWHQAFLAAGRGLQFTRGRRLWLAQPGGGFAHSDEPGRLFPRRLPADGGADPPPDDGRASDDEIAEHL